MVRKVALVLAAILVVIVAVTLGFYASGRNSGNDEIIIGGGGSDGSGEGQNANMVEVVIKSDGGWSATIKDGESRSYSVDGFGDRSIPIACNSGGMYSLVVQKSGGTSGTLNVEVVKSGSV
ncbi:MAG TPA: hypothetical protein VFH09_03850, partial [Nitrososphaera sp.]|nr:hypothetical protein [Nitrososphaera sp.]